LTTDGNSAIVLSDSFEKEQMFCKKPLGCHLTAFCFSEAFFILKTLRQVALNCACRMTCKGLLVVP